MNLTNVWSKLAGAILAVVTFLQLETGLSHLVHVTLACVAIFLGYILGVKTEPPTKTGQVQL